MYIHETVGTSFPQPRLVFCAQIGHNHFRRTGIQKLAAPLASCKSLRSLSLPHNQIESKGLVFLAKELRKQNSALVYLDITCNRGGTSGTRAITEWLMDNRTLQTLVISNNKCGPSGAVALGSVIRYNHTLRHLHMGGNQVEDAGAQAIAEPLSQSHHLETLYLDWNHISNEGATALADAIRRNASLVTLQLGDNHIFDTGALALANSLPYNLALRHLDLSSNQLSDSAAEAFANVLVGANRVFESLNVNGNLDITKTGECRLKQAFRYRESFRIWFGQVLQDNLTTLDLFSRTVGDEELIALSKRPNSPLKALYIGGKLITDRGASEFAQHCLANEECNLTQLYIQDSRIGDEGVAAIAEALKTNRSLRVLSLTFSGITARGANALRNMIQENDTLQRLNLSGNNIGDEGLAALLKGLQNSTTLTALNLVGTGITDAEIDGVGDTCLKDLNLSGNCVSDQGALKLASSLLEDCSLERLCLADNKLLTAKGGQALAAVLRPTSTRFTY